MLRNLIHFWNILIFTLTGQGHIHLRNLDKEERLSALRGFRCAPFASLSPSTLGFASVCWVIGLTAAILVLKEYELSEVFHRSEDERHYDVINMDDLGPRRANLRQQRDPDANRASLQERGSLDVILLIRGVRIHTGVTTYTSREVMSPHVSSRPHALSQYLRQHIFREPLYVYMIITLMGHFRGKLPTCSWKESGKPILGKAILSRPDRYLNPDLLLVSRSNNQTFYSQEERREQEMALLAQQQHKTTTTIVPLTPTTSHSLAPTPSSPLRDLLLPGGNKDAILNSIVQTYKGAKDQSPRKKYHGKFRKNMRKIQVSPSAHSMRVELTSRRAEAREEGGRLCPLAPHTTSTQLNSAGPPRDCRVSEWSPWSTCSKSCGIGEMQRQRQVLKHARRGVQGVPTIGREQVVWKCENLLPALL
uniref:Uncharacterized protein n=1 Tax=Timema bartmani TaxID=61472 RepID=A0A7R9HY16_9NEOP|nr:unnamed protein product [Timema bartmani]